MTDFFAALLNPSLPLLRNALLAGILSSAAFGIIGSFVVVRRISSMAGAISHSVLGGIGLALFCQGHFGWMWFHPLLGAFFAALLSALLIGFARSRSGEREDTVIGAIWAVGMALGLLLIHLTPGYVNPMNYLFGNILMVSQRDLYFIILLDVVVVLAVILLFNQLQAASFDDEFSAVRGINPQFHYYLLLVLTALTIVLMTTIVGIVMVIALLTLPAAISNAFNRRLIPMMISTGIITIILNTTGISLSYILDLPSGPVIILLAGIIYLLSLLIKSLYKKWEKPNIQISNQGD
jgi:zinc transport system permease protein